MVGGGPAGKDTTYNFYARMLCGGLAGSIAEICEIRVYFDETNENVGQAHFH
jgi:hypothetical protein